MDRRQRSSLAGGILLILIGAWFVALQLVPGLKDMLNLEVTWPLFIVAIGGILFVIALVTAVPGLAVPACIVAGVGAILYYQTTAGRWQTWICLLYTSPSPRDRQRGAPRLILRATDAQQPLQHQ